MVVFVDLDEILGGEDGVVVGVVDVHGREELAGATCELRAAEGLKG